MAWTRPPRRAFRRRRLLHRALWRRRHRYLHGLFQQGRLLADRRQGNDTFIVRAFLVAAGTHIGVRAAAATTRIEYNVDAPVDIEGGTGFNTLVLLGTAADDTFVVTQHGIFGGGLNISYTNIQAVTIDGLEGNDTIYVESTPQDVVTTINGGEGDDTIVVGGDVTGAVISASSQARRASPTMP